MFATTLTTFRPEAGHILQQQRDDIYGAAKLGPNAVLGAFTVDLTECQNTDSGSCYLPFLSEETEAQRVSHRPKGRELRCCRSGEEGSCAAHAPSTPALGSAQHMAVRKHKAPAQSKKTMY